MTRIRALSKPAGIVSRLAATILSFLALACASQHVVAAAACSTVAGNLIQNCGFEEVGAPLSTLVSWTDSSNANGVVMRFGASFYAHSGTGSLFLNNDGGGVAIAEQSAGGSGIYDVSFWVRLYDSGVSAPLDFRVLFDGQELMSIVNPTNQAPQAYAEYTFTGVTAQTAALLSFKATYISNVQQRDVIVDDVVVVRRGDLPGRSVPEPSALVLMLAALAAAGLVRRR